jgi:hypothetical protein
MLAAQTTSASHSAGRGGGAPDASAIAGRYPTFKIEARLDCQVHFEPSWIAVAQQRGALDAACTQNNFPQTNCGDLAAA